LAQEQDELGQKLTALDRLRAGTRTPLGSIEKESAALLKEHTAREEQGRIYFLLTESYGQARMSVNGNAAKVIDYAPKALECPLDPVRRLRLYAYWGDAIILSDLSRPLSARRAEAAPIYLKGLKEARQYDIPDVVPKRPPIFLPKDGMDGETFLREREAHYKELRRLRQLETLHYGRKVLQNQLVYFYSRVPYAPDELRKLATETLGNEAPEVNKIMNALAAKRAAMEKGLEP
jgi:hypothetical protein